MLFVFMTGVAYGMACIDGRSRCSGSRAAADSAEAAVWAVLCPYWFAHPSFLVNQAAATMIGIYPPLERVIVIKHRDWRP